MATQEGEKPNENQPIWNLDDDFGKIGGRVNEMSLSWKKSSMKFVKNMKHIHF